MFVHHTDDGRAFADSGGDAFSRAMAYIASGEYARHARLERKWLAVVCPVHGR